MGHKFCEGLLRLGRGRSPYETNSSMPSEEGLEQLGACAQEPDILYVNLDLKIQEARTAGINLSLSPLQYCVLNAPPPPPQKKKKKKKKKKEKF